MIPNTARIGFEYSLKQIVDGIVVHEMKEQNLVPVQGLDYIIEAALRAGSQAPTLYVGLFKGAYTPTPNDEMATFPAAATEQTNYVSATRPVLTLSAASGGETNNLGDEIMFVGTLAEETISGAFISTSSVKGSGVGSLLSAVRFPSPRDLAPGANIELTVAFSMTSI